MNKLSQNQWIGVVASLIVLAVFFSAGQALFSFFNFNETRPIAENNLEESDVIQKDIKEKGFKVEDTSAANKINTNSSNNTQTMDTSNSFSSSVSGLDIQDVVVGTGVEALAGKLITVNYSGAFTDGKVFDSSYSRGVPFEFTLGAGQVIIGWDKGFAGMKVGGKRRLVIPAEFAYGERGVGSIPPNSTLVFEVELLGVR